MTVRSARHEARAAAAARLDAARAQVAPELRVPPYDRSTDFVRPWMLPILRTILRAQTVPLPSVTVDIVRVPTDDGAVRVFRYTPARQTTAGALLWIHGGGHVGGTAAADHAAASALADQAGTRVYSVDYRIGKFPRDFDDCVAVLRWLHAEDSEEVNGQLIAVGGASAGAGLAASVAQHAVDHGLAVCFQLLVYPMLDDATGADGHDQNGRGTFGWTAHLNRIAWDWYLGRARRGEHAPAYAVPSARADLAGLPAAWIGVGDLDLFYDEDIAYAHRLERAGVAVDLHVEPGMYHGADIIDTPTMQAFRRRAAGALRTALHPQTTREREAS